MAPIADERLDALAQVVSARKITPATIRVQDVPGAGAALLGNLRQVDALLVVLDGFAPDADPAGDLETFKLELLVADRDHVERRLERVEKQAKSGDAKLRAEVDELRKVLAHVDAGGAARRLHRRAARRARAADDEAADRGRERPGRHRPRSSRRSSPSCRRRRRPRSATAARRRSTRSPAGSRDALDLITFFTAGEKETRAWTLRQGETALDAAGVDPLRHRARLHPLRGDRLARPRRGGLARRGRRSRASSGSRARRTSSGTATS